MYDPDEMIKAILNWAEDDERGQNFDTAFVESVQEKFERDGEITDRQQSALENIIEGFSINVNEWS